MDINSHSSIPKYSRKSSKSRLRPDVAAAMLSLRWPPQETSTRVDSDDSENEDRSSGASSRRFYQKKSKSKNNNNSNSDQDEPHEYEPVSIPKFQDVQTSWPGFDHEPVPNWVEKYMIAKPFPRTEKEVSSKSSFIMYGSDNADGLSHNKKISKTVKSNNRKDVAKRDILNQNHTDKANSKRINIHIQRTGSCIK